MNIGDKVSWHTVNGQETGEVTSIDEDGITILLDNGKAVVADETSLTKV